MKKLMIVLFSVLGINLMGSALADGCGNSCNAYQTCEPSTSPIEIYSCSGTAEWGATATPTPCAQGLCLPGQTCQPLSQLQQTYSCVNNPLRPAPHKLPHHHKPHGTKDSSD